MFAVFENYIKGIRPVIAPLVVLGGEYSAPLKYLIVFSRNFIAAILLESSLTIRKPDYNTSPLNLISEIISTWHMVLWLQREFIET